jgi:hypothetical protein
MKRGKGRRNVTKAASHQRDSRLRPVNDPLGEGGQAAVASFLVYLFCGRIVFH